MRPQYIRDTPAAQKVKFIRSMKRMPGDRPATAFFVQTGHTHKGN
jgi:hypothetical protein